MSVFTASPPSGPARRVRMSGFTLIELLVVISIIALLIGILLPALGAARGSARSIASLSNLRQIGIGITAYTAERKDYFPMHSSDPIAQIEGTKPRWADYLYAYMQSSDVFLSPNLDERERSGGFMKLMWHSVSDTPSEIAALDTDGDRKGEGGVPNGGTAADGVYQGGYGYNFQYLGNARTTPATPRTFHARVGREVLAASDTVVVGDTAGSRKGSAANEPGDGGAAVYALDPPLGAARGNGKGVGAGFSYYEGGNDENAGAGTYDPEFEYLVRSAPAARNTGDTAGFTFADGHSEALGRAEIDDFDDDGTADNGYWNGFGDANKK